MGAFAVAYHGYFRYTSDIDLFIDSSLENATRIVRAVKQFGFEDPPLTANDFTEAHQVVQLGVAPNRIDLMTSITGVIFEEAWESREQGNMEGLILPFISKGLLKRNKLACGRLQELADAEYL